MNFEEPGMCFGGDIEINKDGIKELFSGSYWQYKTYIKVASKDRFLSRAVDKQGNTIDFL